MSKLDQLIAELCPNGIKFVVLPDVAKISNGKDHKHLADGKYPVYGSGGIMRHAEEYIYDKESVLIPRKGSIGNIFYVNNPFWTVDTIFYTKIDQSKIIPKFFYYFLQTQHIENLNIAGGVPSLTKTELDKINIPLPPLPIQKEIVSILDKFTELQAELQARITQYEYYRNSLLSFGVVERESRRITCFTLGEIGNIFMCKRIFKNQTQYDGEIPFYKIGTFGKYPDAFISKQLFYKYKNNYPYPNKGDVLLSAAGTIGRAVIFDGTPSYFQDSNIVWIANDEKIVTNKYLYYFYSVAQWAISEGGTIARLYNDDIRRTVIPVPSLEEQECIVAILDRFDALTTSLTSGLPAEIKARRKQYEHYRDKLLTFEEQTA
jgi:type I restriction enzyme S subunit